MKTIFKYIFIFLAPAALISCSAGKTAIDSTTRVYHLRDSASVPDGSLIYALPITVFTVTFDLEREISIPGPYMKYAADMLGLRDVITSQSEKWSVAAISIRTSEEIDPSEYYVIESSSLCYANALKLRRSGLILDITPSVYRDNGFERFLKGTDKTFNGFRDLGSDEYFLVQNDTLYRTVKFDSSFVKIPYLVEKKKNLTEEQLAEKAAKSLLELRDGKHSILTGDANVFPQSSAAIDEINRMEKELLELFSGKRVTEKRSVTYTVIPAKENTAKIFTLMRFSRQEGVISASSAAAEPVTAEIEPVRKTKDITIIPRSLAAGEKAQTFDKLYYRLPDVATVRIRMGNQLLFECRKLVDQYGEILQLPANYIIGN